MLLFIQMNSNHKAIMHNAKSLQLRYRMHAVKVLNNQSIHHYITESITKSPNHQIIRSAVVFHVFMFYVGLLIVLLCFMSDIVLFFTDCIVFIDSAV